MSKSSMSKWIVRLLLAFAAALLAAFGQLFLSPRPSLTTDPATLADDGSAIDYCALPVLDGSGKRAVDIPKGGGIAVIGHVGLLVLFGVPLVRHGPTTQLRPTVDDPKRPRAPFRVISPAATARCLFLPSTEASISYCSRSGRPERRMHALVAVDERMIRDQRESQRNGLVDDRRVEVYTVKALPRLRDRRLEQSEIADTGAASGAGRDPFMQGQYLTKREGSRHARRR